jgi:hypothetical protein
VGPDHGMTEEEDATLQLETKDKAAAEEKELEKKDVRGWLGGMQARSPGGGLSPSPLLSPLSSFSLFSLSHTHPPSPSPLFPSFSSCHQIEDEIKGLEDDALHEVEEIEGNDALTDEQKEQEVEVRRTMMLIWMRG